MSVDPADCLTILRADGNGKSFSFDFRLFMKADGDHTVQVLSLAADGTYKEYKENIDYHINWQKQGGIVEFSFIPAKDLFIIMKSAVPMTQHYQFQTGQIPDGFVLTGALDDLTMKIIQCCCELSNKVSIDRDPKTGKVPKVVVAGALQPGKIIETDGNGKIISSNFSKTDLTDLGHATALAAHNAQTAATTATQANIAALAAQKAAEKAKKDADSSMHLAMTGATDANKAAVDAKKSQDAAAQSALALQNMQQALGALATAAGSTPAHYDILMGDSNNKWIKYAGTDFIDELVKLLLSNDELLGKFNDKLAGLPLSGVGGGGGTGGGGGLAAVFAGATAGEGLIANPSLPTKFELKPMLVGDSSKAGKLIQYNAQGGFTAVDPPKTKGAVTIDPGANTGMTIDSAIVVDPNRPKGCFPLQACYDDVSKVLTLKEGKIMSGSSNIPDPTKPDQILSTETATNGGIVYGWHDSLIQKPAQGDDGKVWISDGSGGFVLKPALEASDASKRIMGVTGVIDALDHVETAPAAQLTLKPFKVIHADPQTFVTTEHEFTSNTVVAIPTGFPNNGNFWVYVDPASWTIKTKTTPLTEQEIIDNVVLLEAHVDNNTIDALNFIYNPISHQEYILREIGLAVGIQARGIRFTVSTDRMITGSVKGYLFRFLGEANDNIYPQSTYYLPPTTSYNFDFFYVVTKKQLTKATSWGMLKQYQDSSGTLLSIPANKFTIHHLYLSPLLSTFDTNKNEYKLTGCFFVVGNALYDSIDAAKVDLDTSLSDLEMDIGLINNSVLVGKWIAGAATNTGIANTFFYTNTANINTAGASIIHSAVVPDPAGIADGTALSVKNGKYVFDSSIKPAFLDVSNIPANSVLTYDRGKIEGKSTTAVATGLNTLDGIYKNIYFIEEIDVSSGGIVDFDTSGNTPPALLSHNGISKVVQTTTTNSLGYKMQKLVVTHIPITDIFAARFSIYGVSNGGKTMANVVMEVVGVEAVSTTETVLHAIPFMQDWYVTPGRANASNKVSVLVEIIYL